MSLRLVCTLLVGCDVVTGFPAASERPDASPSSCTDGVQDGDETDVDCGGPGCPACPAERACALGRDCASTDCCAGRCEAWLPGWRYRHRVGVENPGDDLADFQVRIYPFDAHSPIAMGKLLGNAADLRVTGADRVTPLPHAIGGSLHSFIGPATMWARVPLVPHGASEFYVYYGNPIATSTDDREATFIPGLIANPDFEDATGWTPEGQVANVILPDCGSVVDQGCALAMTPTGQPGTTTRVTQLVDFPDDSAYRIIIDVALGGCTLGHCAARLLAGDEVAWQIAPRTDNQFDIETTVPLSGPTSIAIESFITDGIDVGFAQFLADDLRVRRNADPDPAVSIGEETELCP